MSELLTNFKDDILAESMEGRRRYQMITNEDGTVSFVDVTEYAQVGSEFGQAEINAIHREINSKFDSGDVVDPLTVEEAGFAADAKLTGDALREVSVNLEQVFQSASSGKTAIINAITAAGGTVSKDAGYSEIALALKDVKLLKKSTIYSLYPNDQLGLLGTVPYAAETGNNAKRQSQFAHSKSFDCTPFRIITITGTARGGSSNNAHYAKRTFNIVDESGKVLLTTSKTTYAKDFTSLTVDINVSNIKVKVKITSTYDTSDWSVYSGFTRSGYIIETIAALT